MANTEVESNKAVTDLQNAIASARDFEMYDEAEAAFRQKYNLEEYSWGLIQAYRRRKQRNDVRREHKRFIEELQDKLCEEKIRAFLERHFKGADKTEEALVREQIAKETKWLDTHYDYSLHDMVRDGLPGMHKRHKQRHLKHFVHTWAAIKALIAIGFILAIYSKLQTTFEIIVGSVLILLYTTLTRARQSQSMAAASFNQAGYIRYIELKKVLKSEPNDKEMGDLWELEKGIEESTVRHYVVDSGNSIINLIAFVNLFRTLF